jgi:hypothetical protein
MSQPKWKQYLLLKPPLKKLELLPTSKEEIDKHIHRKVTVEAYGHLRKWIDDFEKQNLHKS